MALEERKQIVLDAGDIDRTSREGTGRMAGVDTTVAGVGHTNGVDTNGVNTAGECLTEIEYLDSEIEKPENERNCMIMERADFDRTGMHPRMLLELVDGMLQDRMGNTHAVEIGNTAAGVDTSVAETQGVSERIYDDACYDYEEFFERTRYRIPKKELWNGRETAYDNDMVVRFLDKVIVKDDGYEIWFKGGIMVEG